MLRLSNDVIKVGISQEIVIVPWGQTKRRINLYLRCGNLGIKQVKLALEDKASYLKHNSTR